MSADVEITCKPGDGILRVSAETITALDRLGATLPADIPWQIDVLLGHTPADTIHLTVTPATPDEPEEAAA